MDKTNKKDAIFLSLTGIALIGMFFFIIMPIKSQIEEISDNIGLEKESLEQKSFLGQNIEKNISELSKVKKSTKLSGSFVESDKELNFIESLETMAKNLSIEQNIDVEEMTDSKAQELPLIIELKGDYPDLLKYLSELERSDYYININSLIIKNSGSGSTARRNTIIEESINNIKTENKLNFSIKASAYIK